MLETVKTLVSRRVRKSFDERYADYLISVHNKSIALELEYLKRHNKLDVMKLDKLINSSFEKAITL